MSRNREENKTIKYFGMVGIACLLMLLIMSILTVDNTLENLVKIIVSNQMFMFAAMGIFAVIMGD